MTKSLKPWTQARIDLNRCGDAIATRELLDFKMAHASARDAVHAQWNVDQTKAAVTALSQDCLLVSSQVQNRADYLRRPDLGRRLSKKSQDLLLAKRSERPYEIVFIVSDGLSALAIDSHFLAVWAELQKSYLFAQEEAAPLILAPFSRVAIADEIGFYLNAKLTMIFIGERPGLSSYDSLGVYLTFDPKPGNTDANRNCISNVRGPEGLSYEGAVAKIQYLIRESLTRKISGVALKEEASAETPLPSKSLSQS